jgi:hypothetical protein
MSRYHIQHFSDRPFKIYNFWKIPLHYIDRILPLSPFINFGGSPQISGKSLWQAADHQKNRFVHFYLLLLWRSRLKAKNWRYYCPRGIRFSNCDLQVADSTPLKSGVDIPEISQKVEPHTWYQISLHSGATCKQIFTSIERCWIRLYSSFWTNDQKIFKYSNGSYWRPKASPEMFLWNIFPCQCPFNGDILWLR